MKILRQIAILIVLSALLALLRPLLPNGISFMNDWPSESASPQDAYALISEPGDPAFIGLSELIQIRREGDVVILDARKIEDFKAGRIPSSRPLPFYDIEPYRESALDGVLADDPLVVYCEGVGCELSLFLGRELQAAGFSQVRIFYGGWPEWKKAGLPIEEGPVD